MGCSKKMQIKTLEELGFPSYAVMDNGVVFRVDHLRPVKPDINWAGYARVGLNQDGHYERFAVHRLVADVFVPNPENKSCVNHIDGNPANNSVGNLEWVTHAENTQHSIEQGTFRPSKKLTVAEAEFVKSSPLGYGVLSEMFGVSRAAIYYHKRQLVKEV